MDMCRAMRKLRDPIFDIVKFVAIYLVVYGHVMGYRPGFELRDCPSFAANFIIAVNMPIFFVVSGYFSRRLHEIGGWIKLSSRGVKYFWPLAVSSLCVAFLENDDFIDIPVAAIKKFLFGGWFLYALAGCDIITFVSYRLCKRTLSRIFCGIAFFFLALVLSGHFLHMSEIVAMIPFYWFGLMMLPLIMKSDRMLYYGAVVGAVVMCFVTFFYGNIATNGLAFYWDRFDVWNPHGRQFANMLLRYAVGVAGSIFIIGTAKSVVRIAPCVSRVSYLGTETLGVYFLQGPIIMHVVIPYVRLDINGLTLIMASSFVFAVAFLVTKLIKLNKLLNVFIFGYTSYAYSKSANDPIEERE